MRPLFSYVALIVRQAGPEAERIRARLAARLGDWTSVLDHGLAQVWARRDPLSALAWRALEPVGCVLGLEQGALLRTDDLGRSWGAYVAVAVDAGRRAVRVLRDPTGRIECWRMELPGCEVLFSHLEDVHDLAERPPAVNWPYLAHHLNQDYLHGRETALEGVTELLPGEEIVYQPGGSATRLAWRPESVAAEPWSNPAEARARLREAAEICVSGWAARYPRLLLDLSGGLDSSVVLGLVRGHAGHPEVIALTRTTAGAEGDEREFARASARRHGVRLFEQSPEPPGPGLGPNFPRRLMRPRARVIPLGYDEAGAEAAVRFEAPAFFTGTGGDHLFYNNVPVSAACDYLHHRGAWSGYPACAAALARLAGDTVWNVAAETLRRRFGPAEGLHDIAAVPNPYVSELARASLDYARFAHPAALAALTDAPPAKRRQIVFMLELQRHYYRYGRADACEEVHPLVSQPVMEASLRTPAHWFLAGGVQRGLARQAFADLLPPQVLERRTKGAISVHWTRFLLDRLPALRELLLDGRVAARGLLDRAALEAVLTPGALTATADFMPLSTCISTELWVRQAEADRGEILAPRLADRAP